MAIGSGLGGSFGAKQETTYGTYAAPDHFYKVTKASLNRVKNTVQGGGFASGQMVPDGVRRAFVTQAATGTVEGEVGTKGFGLILQHIFGTTVTPVIQGATTAYLQTHVLADNFGKSLTMQAGVPNRLGTVTPFTLLGGKITSATFTCSVNELLRFSLAVDGQQVIDSQSISAVSYATGIVPFHFGDLTVKLGAFGSEAAVGGVKAITLTIERPQQTDGFYAGAAVLGTKDEPVMNDWVKVSGSVDIDFKVKADFYDRFRDDTATSMVFDWKKPVPIASTFYPELVFTMPQTFFDGDTPTLESNDVVGTSIPFTSLFDLTNQAVGATYMSTDVTV